MTPSSPLRRAVRAIPATGALVALVTAGVLPLVSTPPTDVAFTPAAVVAAEPAPAAAPAAPAPAAPAAPVPAAEGGDAPVEPLPPLPPLPPEFDTPEMRDLRDRAQAARDALTGATEQLREGQARAAADRAASQEARDRAAAARARADGARDAVEDYARAIYRGGDPLSAASLFAALEDGDLDLLAERIGYLESVQREQNAELAVFFSAQREADEAAAEADRRAEAAQAEEERLAGELTRLSGDATRLAGELQAALSAVVQERVAQADSFPNGLLPDEVLCPVGVGEHRLRCDAANGLRQLTDAYTIHFGTPPCIGDTYRSYQAQVDVFATKPGLAAVPGTSNHGTGMAVDFCDGASVAGTPEDVWMHANAPHYGWAHPTWAEPGGSRPEPWHWEFIGSPAVPAAGSVPTGSHVPATGPAPAGLVPAPAAPAPAPAP